MEIGDAEEIRSALVARLIDSDDDTRAEAITGLASRKDKRALEPLKRELATVDFEMDCSRAMNFVGAAGKLGDSELHPLLVKLRGVVPEDDKPYLERAIEACAPIK